MASLEVVKESEKYGTNLSTSVAVVGTVCRHVKINGSPVSLTENSAVFRKTDFQKKSRIFKNPLSLTVFFLLKAISCDNLA